MSPDDPETAKTEPSPAASRTHVYRVNVQFGDCDPAGIVFFPNFNRWMDEASLAFFMACGIPLWRELVKTRGIFVGGGGSVRISRLIGVARMTDMMLTGRVFDADEGQAFAISNYRVADGQGLDKALQLAQKIAGNAPLSNYAITQALPRIADLSASDGLFMESLISSIAQGDEAAKERVPAFLKGRSAKVTKATA